MGFFKKLFRRKSSGDGSPTVASLTSATAAAAAAAAPNTRKERRAVKRQQKMGHRDDSPTQLLTDDVFIPPSTNSARNSRGPDMSDGTQRPVLSPRNLAAMSAGSSQTAFKASTPVDLDDSRSESHSESYSRSNSYEEKKADDENRASGVPSPRPSAAPVLQLPTEEPLHHSGPVFTMPDSAAQQQPKLRFSAGNVSVEDDTDGESSSFNLSTDAEDTEYEALRRRLGGTVPMDMSVTNYTTDGETSVFQGLPSEDDATMTTASVTKEASQQSILHLPTVNPATGASLVPVGPYVGTTGFPGVSYKDDNRFTKPQQEEMRFALPDDSRFSKPQQEEMRFALPDDTRFSKPQQEDSRFSKPQQKDSRFAAFANDPLDDSGDDKIDLPRRSTTIPSLTLPKKDSPERKRSPKFAKPPITANGNFTQFNSHFMEAIYGSPTEKSQQRRSFTSPKKQPPVQAANFEPFAGELPPFDVAAPFASNTKNDDENLFANFADFSNFDNVFQVPAPEPQPITNGGSAFLEHDEKPRSSRGSQRNLVASSSASAVHNETSLSELLAQAKSKSSRSGSSHPKKTSTSVSSAPAMTASYLRQHHNLGKSRTNHDGTSVTDIIHSLEAANASRGTTGSSSRSLGGSRHSRTHSRDDGQSAHSRDGASVRSAKEKLRRRRERRHQRGAGEHSSDSEDDHEDNESWLFDEVTGALGPRGIAADLESLSGRSNRSNSSRGNRSHKSHRSHKSGSRPSRRRPKTGSGDSVDSRHSRDSRRSRGSRYSHRSTRSYISQMSEQSRSVANDLLRLEMQLAMVGSGGPGAPEDRNSSVGGRSRVARTAVASPAAPIAGRRTATARRSRITVHAPPGKLGIILANKADSKGTVVSGVRTSSALAEKITPGDRIVAIDGEDVSLMTVSEITTIMARKADFDRTLTVLTTPRHTETTASIGSPRSSSDSFQQHRSAYRS